VIFYLLICRSLTYAQRTAKALERAGIRAIVMRTPHSISTDGCSYCVRISENRLSDSLVILKNASISPRRIYVMNKDGRCDEVDI
jgi:NADH/NAD ratio-sensing transcriptional regulator Rex